MRCLITGGAGFIGSHLSDVLLARGHDVHILDDLSTGAVAHWKARQLPAVVGRLFNTAAPRQTGRYGMVIPRFGRQALAGQPLTVYGDGTQRRVFCHVRDVTPVLAELMERDDVYGEVFNIGGSEEVSIAELAEHVRALADSESEVLMVPYDDAYEPGFEDMARR